MCSINDKKVAHIIYEKDEHKISVFMFEAGNMKKPDGKKVVLNNREFYVASEKGYNSILWIDKGIGCMMTSDLDEADLIYLVKNINT